MPLGQTPLGQTRGEQTRRVRTDRSPPRAAAALPTFDISLRYRAPLLTCERDTPFLEVIQVDVHVLIIVKESQAFF